MEGWNGRSDHSGLKLFIGPHQQTAAERMKIFRPTLGRVLAEAREIIAKALVMGEKLKIEGGDFETPGKGFKKGRLIRGGRE